MHARTHTSMFAHIHTNMHTPVRTRSMHDKTETMELTTSPHPCVKLVEYLAENEHVEDVRREVVREHLRLERDAHGSHGGRVGVPVGPLRRRARVRKWRALVRVSVHGAPDARTTFRHVHGRATPSGHVNMRWFERSSQSKLRFR